MGFITAVSGHRPNKLGGYSLEAQTKLISFAEFTLRKEWITNDTVITGMAQGWDMAVANACINIGIPFIAAIPFKGQESIWPKEAQDRYNRILAKAAKICIICDKQNNQAFKDRNIFMVDRSNRLLTLHDGTMGGTAHCKNYAKSKNKSILNVYSNWLLF